MYSILIYIHIKGLGRKAFKCYYIKKPIVTSSHSPLDILLYDKYQKLMDHSSAVVA